MDGRGRGEGGVAMRLTRTLLIACALTVAVATATEQLPAPFKAPVDSPACNEKSIQPPIGLSSVSRVATI